MTERLTNRLYKRLTREHLRLLAELARDEHEAFFERNPHQAPLYRDRLMAAALCQGAALHYLDDETGVKDLDLHLFYAQHPEHRRLSRTVYSRRVHIAGFGTRAGWKACATLCPVTLSLPLEHLYGSWVFSRKRARTFRVSSARVMPVCSVKWRRTPASFRSSARSFSDVSRSL